MTTTQVTNTTTALWTLLKHCRLVPNQYAPDGQLYTIVTDATTGIYSTVVVRYTMVRRHWCTSHATTTHSHGFKAL